eukprot:TRINITY_DN62251_c0_g1_i1.p1 TRINITY_DN62251_c0_g1~~TRINITY_DN62251_c0_g1_i1.p1  ORF type:complete len:333 (+),score=24.17 TRINITY_DN62251_c0_g1_i1:82-1080(+)
MVNPNDRPNFWGPILMILGFVVCVPVCCCTYFMKKLHFGNNCVSGLCVDGRLRNEELRNATIGVDDSSVSKRNVITMQCVFPVHVYPCAHAGRDCSDKPLRTRERVESTGLSCDLSLVNHAHDCRYPNWYCETGKCTAYEKAKSLCASHFLKQQPYECWYVPGEALAGIRFEKPGFPFLWCLASILGVLSAGPCLWLWVKIWRVQYAKYGIAGVKRSFLSLAVIFCCFIAVFVFICFTRFDFDTDASRRAANVPSVNGRVDSEEVQWYITAGWICLPLSVLPIIVICGVTVYDERTAGEEESNDPGVPLVNQNPPQVNSINRAALDFKNKLR